MSGHLRRFLRAGAAVFALEYAMPAGSRGFLTHEIREFFRECGYAEIRRRHGTNMNPRGAHGSSNTRSSRVAMSKKIT